MMSQSQQNQDQQSEVEPITTEEMALYQLLHKPPRPRRRPDNGWQWLAEIVVNEHGLENPNCRCRVCRAWWRRSA
jgi:hypothetical protein